MSAELIEAPVGDIVDPMAISVSIPSQDLGRARHKDVFIGNFIKRDYAELRSFLSGKCKC